MKKFLLLFVIVFFVKTIDLLASISGFQISAGAGNFGINTQIGYRYFDKKYYSKSLLGIRLDFNFFDSNNFGESSNPLKISDVNDDDFHFFKNLDNDDEFGNHSESVKSFLAGAILDFYPFGNIWGFSGFRLSSGYYFGKIDYTVVNSFTATGQKIYNNYVYDDLITSNDFKLGVNGFYFGAGADIEILYSWKMVVDIGIIPLNRKSVDLKILGNANIHGTSIFDYANRDFIEMLKNDNREAYKKYDKKYIPIFKIGLAYRF